MLRDLLRSAVGEGTQRTTELGRELGITPALVTEMLQQLEREGYLKAIVPGCSTPCEGCTEHAVCLFRQSPRVWVLTEKGERLLSAEV